MSFTLCTSGAIVMKAGANVSSVAKASGAILQQYSEDAEGFIYNNTRYDWVANYAGLSTAAKTVLSDITSSRAAISLMSYDPSGYTSRGEYEDVVNVLWDSVNAGLTSLKKLKIPEVNL